MGKPQFKNCGFFFYSFYFSCPTGHIFKQTPQVSLRPKVAFALERYS